ncbi:hypothetical protein [Ruicaihuangia caeni]|uniref:hypothetical protein n=1 Tax=Ruicaihuangia caeni TaxID=3042517 RepID=UPI00338ED5C7
MRWPNLFDDLEAQFAAEHGLERAAVDAERARAARARQTLLERVAQFVRDAGDEATVNVTARGVPMSLRVLDVGLDWISGEEQGSGGSALGGHRGMAIVSASAIDAIEFLDPASARPVPGEASPVIRRLGIVSPLRELARRRRTVLVRAVTLERVGTIDAVGSDYLELAVHEPGVPPRSAAVRQRLLVPVAQLVVVRG